MDLTIISGNSNKPLAESIAKKLGVDLCNSLITRFADNEINVEIRESIRGKDVFVIQSTSSPANDNLMELLVTIDALKRGSAGRITAVIPYFGYARQDRKAFSRAPISAKLVANLLTVAGTDRVLTLDLHAAQIQGFFDIPVDNLFANFMFLDDIKKRLDTSSLVIVSPDYGGVTRASVLAKILGCEIAVIDKRRPKPGYSFVMNIIGNVDKKHCIIIDDIVDTAGTLCNAANMLKEKGALSVVGYITHGVLSNQAVAKINNSILDKIICTDSIKPSKDFIKSDKLEQMTISQLLASSIKKIHDEESLSGLFL